MIPEVLGPSASQGFELFGVEKKYFRAKRRKTR
jgi:hypothetical protein